VGKTTLLRQKSQQAHFSITELQLNLQKHVTICCFSFNKISINRKKTVLQENFDLMISFDIF